MGENTDGDNPGAGTDDIPSPPLRRVLWAYERFEQFVAIVLAVLIALIVMLALVELLRIVAYMVETETLNLLRQETFQLVFGMIMTLLIALEFKHSIVKVALRSGSVIQAKTVILIALLALARKFVILDPATGPATIAALALALLALGVVYWLMRERDGLDARRRLERKGAGETDDAAPGQPRQ